MPSAQKNKMLFLLIHWCYRCE